MLGFSFSKMHVIVKAWKEMETRRFQYLHNNFRDGYTIRDSFVRALLDYRTILRFTFLSAFMLHFLPLLHDYVWYSHITHYALF